ncbi:MAG: hypothetical protein H6Q67_1060 [Firmicutes bacterium]|nr:hypothetical protein [Bacillota bacterium]
MITTSREIEERAVERIADLMCVSARTAPKARGVDNLVTMIVKAREKELLAETMRRMSKTHEAPTFVRDAECVDKAALVVLLGQKVSPIGVKPCGLCGFSDCGECVTKHGRCAISVGDFGIAVGSAASTAAMHHVDNRVMYTVGKAALELDLFEDAVHLVYGIPLSVSGKNPFFDR